MTAPPVSALHAARILQAWEGGGLLPRSAAGAFFVSPPDALEEERRELLDSILQELRTVEPARDRAIVCRSLLMHLAQARPLP